LHTVIKSQFNHVCFQREVSADFDKKVEEKEEEEDEEEDGME